MLEKVSRITNVDSSTAVEKKNLKENHSLET